MPRISFIVFCIMLSLAANVFAIERRKDPDLSLPQKSDVEKPESKIEPKKDSIETVDISKAKTETCVACHGEKGNSVTGIWPKIAGQHEKYLLDQLKAFKEGESGDRYDPSMYPMVIGLSEQDLANLAAFYSQQEIKLGKTNEKYVALGEKIYRGGNLDTGVSACIACHGPKGMGNELAGFPRLSGQHPEYTIAQLKKYRDGGRKSDPNAIMRDIAKNMTDEEIEAVSHYVSGLY